MPDLQAIAGRVGRASMGMAVVKTGVDCMEQLDLQVSPVAIKRSWSRRVLDVASHLFRRS